MNRAFAYTECGLSPRYLQIYAPQKDEAMSTAESQDESSADTPRKSLNAVQRRILGVLIEKARTTPDAYPLSLNGLVTGCNQKSNRAPLMNLTAEQVEDELFTLREQGIVAEVHGGGRVAKYRHYAHDFLDVKGSAVGVMAELLLRGEQTVGELRTRASRFEAIPDLAHLQEILTSLEEKQLVVALSPPGRGQLYTHNLYEEGELEAIAEAVKSTGGQPRAATNVPTTSARSSELAELRTTLSELQAAVEALSERVTRLES